MDDKSIKETKGIRDFPRHEVSPFFKGLYQVKTRNKTIALGQRYGLFDAKTGDIERSKVAFVGVRKVVDRGEFVKVFKGSISALFELSPKAQKVYSYFMEAQRMNDHLVYFDHEECQERTGYKSPRSVYEGLAQLLEKSFVARASKSNFFFINPEITFNGDRLVQWNDWVVRGTKAHEEALASEAKAQQLDIEHVLDNQEENKEAAIAARVD